MAIGFVGLVGEGVYRVCRVYMAIGVVGLVGFRA